MNGIMVTDRIMLTGWKIVLDSKMANGQGKNNGYRWINGRKTIDFDLLTYRCYISQKQTFDVGCYKENLSNQF